MVSRWGLTRLFSLHQAPSLKKILAFLRCVFSNVSSNHMSENIQNHIGCICRYFVFSNVYQTGMVYFLERRRGGMILFLERCRVVWLSSSRDVEVVWFFSSRDVEWYGLVPRETWGWYGFVPREM